MSLEKILRKIYRFQNGNSFQFGKNWKELERLEVDKT